MGFQRQFGSQAASFASNVLPGTSCSHLVLKAFEGANAAFKYGQLGALAIPFAVIELKKKEKSMAAVVSRKP